MLPENGTFNWETQGFLYERMIAQGKNNVNNNLRNVILLKH